MSSSKLKLQKRAGKAPKSTRSRKRAKPAALRAGEPVIGYLGRQSEYLFVDSALSTISVTTTPVVQHINIVPRGNSINSREQTTWRNKSLWIRGDSRQGLTATVSTWMWAVVWDRRPNGALAAFTDVFDSASPNSFPKRQNQSRFKILRLQRYSLGGNSTTPNTDETTTLVEDYIKFPKDLWSQCTDADTTGVIGNTQIGALLFMHCGDSAAAGTFPTLVLNFRLNFTDKIKGSN